MTVTKAVLDFKERQDELFSFREIVMTEGIDYGKIVGDRPSLLKPGAELLVSFFGFHVLTNIDEQVIDWSGAEHGGEPLFYIRHYCRMFRGGKCIGDGYGMANSREAKYRYRWVDEVPAGVHPDHVVVRRQVSSEFTFAVQKAETGGKYGKPEEYWLAFENAIQDGTAKKGHREAGSGKSYDTWEVETIKYRVPNPDISDMFNTVLKMSHKRAFVAAALVASAASKFFTQDLEDIPELGTMQAWLPNFTEFCKSTLPGLPNLMAEFSESAAKYKAIGDLIKSKFDLGNGWEPAVASEAKKYLLSLEPSPTSVTAPTTSPPTPMNPKEAFEWLAESADKAGFFDSGAEKFQPDDVPTDPDPFAASWLNAYRQLDGMLIEGDWNIPQRPIILSEEPLTDTAGVPGEGTDNPGLSRN